MAQPARRGMFWVGIAPFLWLLAFFLLPFLIVFKISLSEKATAQPPYRPVFDLTMGLDALRERLGALSLENYLAVFQDELLWSAYLTALRIAGTATLLTLILGLALAVSMARAPEKWRPMLVTLVILPFLTSFLIRAYAWIGILKPEGLLNALLIKSGLITEPLIILNTDIAVLIGIVYSYLPFMVLPVYASLEKMDPHLLEAAADLGARPMQAFLLVTMPVILPGIIAGCALVFIPAIGEIIIPDLLGGSDTLMIGRVLWNEFFANRDWPLAGAMATVLLVIVLVPVLASQRWIGRDTA